MENISEYKKQFMETRIKGDFSGLTENQTFLCNNMRLSKHIADMEIPLSDAVQCVFNKLNNPVLIVCDDNIEYVNQAFLKILNYEDPAKVLNQKFLKFVSQDDWNFIAENIGDILTEGGSVELRMLNSDYKVIKLTFDTVYLEDKQRFCFILVGRQADKAKTLSETSLYDEKVGLPKFALYEDRVQRAIDYENYKSPSAGRNKIGICGIAVRNYTVLKNDGQIDFIIQRLSEKLLLGLNKLYTVAVGSKYQFWLLLPDMQSEVELQQEVINIQNMLNGSIAKNNIRYDVSVAIGVSMYPDTAQSAKKLIAQAEMSVRQALKAKQSQIIYFGA